MKLAILTISDICFEASLRNTIMSDRITPNTKESEYIIAVVGIHEFNISLDPCPASILERKDSKERLVLYKSSNRRLRRVFKLMMTILT